MNYIGSKHSLLDFLEGGILARAGTERGVFLDLFAGTGVVGRRFKALGFREASLDPVGYREGGADLEPAVPPSQGAASALLG